MENWAWRLLALIGTGLLLVFLAVPPDVHWWAQWAIELLVIAALVAGPRLHRLVDRRPWRRFLWAMVAISCSDVVIVVLNWLGAPRAVVDTMNVGFVAGYLLVGAGLWVLVWAHSAGSGRREVLADGAIVGFGTALVLWQLVAPPDLVGLIGLTPGVTSQAIVATYPLIQATISAFTVLLMFSGRMRLASTRLLTLGGLALVAGNTGYLMALRTGTFEYGSWIDALWPVSYLLIGLAVLHPSMLELGGRPSPESARVPSTRIGMLVIALALTQASILAGNDQPAWGAQVISLSLLLTGVILWRVVRLIRERELARAELDRTVERQAAVARLGSQALTGADHDALLAQALGVLTDHLGAPWAALLRPVPDGSRRRLWAGWGPVPAVAMCWRVPEESEVLLLGGAQVALVGVRGRREVFGALACQAPAGRAIGDVEMQFVRSVANVLAGALERHLAEDEIRQQALHDALTGLPNRVLLIDRLEAALDRARRSGRRVAVLFMDLDKFKEVNDGYGHSAGDQLLREVVARVRPLLRAEDTLARFAGDEFVAVTEIEDGGDALACARRINAALARPFRLEAAEVCISASIGVALAGDGATADGLLMDADAAMYSAKEQGRGRSEVFGAAPSAP